jgi:hypothetical protein
MIVTDQPRGRRPSPPPQRCSGGSALLPWPALLMLLARHEREVTDLAAESGQPIPAVSDRLARSRSAGLITARRRRRCRFHAGSDPEVLALVEGAVAEHQHRRPRRTMPHSEHA